MKRIYAVLFLVMTIFLFNPSIKVNAEENQEQWKVFMYVCGDNLESRKCYWSNSVAEIEQEIPRAGVSYVVNFGGAKSSKAMGESLLHERYLLWSSDSNGWKNLLNDDNPPADMGSISTLRRFLEFSNEKDVAHKVLVFWDHGGGSLFGVCHDENTDTMLSLDSLRDAMNDVYEEDPENPPFDIIIFNACLMGNIDTLKSLKGFAKYVVASEEVAPGEGMDYSVMVRELNNNPEISPLNLAKKMCDGYMEKCHRNRTDWCATMSVVDMSKLDNLINAYENFGEAVFQKVKENPHETIYEFVRNSYWVEDYGGNTETSGFFNMMDLRGFAQNNRKLVPREAEELMKAVDKSVVYNRHGKYRSGSAGISFYIPMDTEFESMELYKSLDINSPTYVKLYETLLRHKDFYNLIDIFGKEISVNSNNRFEVRLTQEEMNKLVDMQALMGYVAPDGQCYLLGEDDRVDFSNCKKGIFTDDDLGDWIALNGHFLSTTVEDIQEKYTVLSAPIKWNDIPCDVVFIYNFDTKTYEIAGLTYAEDKERRMLANPYKGTISKGDKITIMNRPYEVKYNNLHIGELIEGETFVLSDEPEITDKLLLPDGQYEFFFRFVNPLGIVALSQVGRLDLVNGAPIF